MGRDRPPPEPEGIHQQIAFGFELHLLPGSPPCTFWVCQPPSPHEPIPYNKSLSYISLVLWRTLPDAGGVGESGNGIFKALLGRWCAAR